MCTSVSPLVEKDGGRSSKSTEETISQPRVASLIGRGAAGPDCGPGISLSAPALYFCPLKSALYVKPNPQHSCGCGCSKEREKDERKMHFDWQQMFLTSCVLDFFKISVNNAMSAYLKNINLNSKSFAYTVNKAQLHPTLLK